MLYNACSTGKHWLDELGSLKVPSKRFRTYWEGIWGVVLMIRCTLYNKHCKTKRRGCSSGGLNGVVGGVWTAAVCRWRFALVHSFWPPLLLTSTKEHHSLHSCGTSGSPFTSQRARNFLNEQFTLTSATPPPRPPSRVWKKRSGNRRGISFSRVLSWLAIGDWRFVGSNWTIDNCEMRKFGEHSDSTPNSRSLTSHPTTWNCFEDLRILRFRQRQ